MLIDRHLPRGRFARARSTVVDAYPEETFEALGTTDLAGDPLLRTLYRVSRLPGRVAMRWRGRTPAPPAERLTMKEVMWREGWVALDERAGDEVVSGVVLRTRGFPPLRLQRVAASDFADFHEPGHLKLAASMSVRPHAPARSLLVMETRAEATDARTRRLLDLAWRYSASASEALMDRMLRDVRRHAELVHPPPRPREAPPTHPPERPAGP